MGINVPEEYGGVGADEVTKALVIMEFAKYDASVAELLAVHTLSSDIILKHGTPEQKEKYLTKACTGAVGAFALTEPNAGSDAAARSPILSSVFGTVNPGVSRSTIIADIPFVFFSGGRVYH